MVVQRGVTWGGAGAHLEREGGGGLGGGGAPTNGAKQWAKQWAQTVGPTSGAKQSPPKVGTNSWKKVCKSAVLHLQKWGFAFTKVGFWSYKNGFLHLQKWVFGG